MNGTTLMLYPSLFISLFLSNYYAVVDKKTAIVELYPVHSIDDLYLHFISLVCDADEIFILRNLLFETVKVAL